MIIYVIKSALTLALLYSLFFACLSRETFHRFNRVCLILIMIAAMGLPLVHITISQPTPINEVAMIPEAYLSEVVVMATPADVQTPLTWGTLLTYIYAAGAAIMLLTSFGQTLAMVRLMRGGLRHTDERGNTVILREGIPSPFSIFHWIVMDVDDYENHRHSILVHEQEHIRLGHTYDLLLLEVMKVMQWFNPFVWFLSHDMRALHEYEADEAVLDKGIDAKQYQQLLVLKAVGNRLQPFANTLGRGSLKQRIIMMYQKKSNRWMMLKALFIVPTMGLALYAFATPEALPDVESVLHDKVAASAENDSPVQINITDKAQIPLALGLTSQMDDDCEIVTDDEEEVSEEMDIRGLTADDVIIVDGKEVTAKQMKALSPEDINNMTILKDVATQTALKSFNIGREVKGNVIVVETQAYAKAKNKAEKTDATTANADVDVRVDDNKVYDKPDVLPTYEGGEENMMKYFMTTLRYPIKAMEIGAQGRVYVQFVVEKDGNLSDVKAIRLDEYNATKDRSLAEIVVKAKAKKASEQTDEEAKASVEAEKDGYLALLAEAERVVGSMSCWNPGKTKNKAGRMEAVRTRFFVPITFRLN